MSQLAANSPQTYEYGLTNTLPIKGSTEIFLGSAVGITAGYARQLTAGDIFAGFAEQHVNNTGSDGAASLPVMREGRIVLAVSGAAVTDIGKPVYASDGNTFTLTAGSNSRVGYIYRWVSTGVVVVEFYTSSKLITGTITDSTGGTPSTTFAAITAGAAYAQADMVAVKNALSQIAASLNAIIQAGQ